MNFEERARKACDRGQPVRAAVLLIEGLKRHPEALQALELLREIYLEELTSAGLEYDLSSVLVLQPDAAEQFQTLVSELYRREKASMGRELVRAAHEHGIAVQWPPPEPVEGLPVEDPARAADGVDAAAEREAVPPSSEEPALDEEPAALSDPKPAPKDEPANDCAVEQQPEADREPGAAPDTEQGDQSAPESAPLEQGLVDTTVDSDASSQQPRERAAISRRLVSVVVIVALAVAATGFWVWTQRAPGGDLGQLDRAIERLDPSAGDQATALFAPYGDTSGLDTPVAERRAFIQAVRAADWGERSASVSSSQTMWGRAALATSHALQGDFEAALTHTARLERSDPRALASLWARGFVAEARGRHALAARHYAEGHERFGKFVPFAVGQLRVAARQGRADEVERVQSWIETQSPQNPYLELGRPWVTLDDLIPKEAGGEPDEPTDPVAIGQAPRFVEACRLVERAVDSLADGDVELAREYAESAIDREPYLGPGLLLVGVLRGVDAQIKESHELFSRLAQLPGLTEEYRWTLQIAAPSVFIGLGRAELAYQFVPPVKGAGRVTERGGDDDKTSLPLSVVPLLSIEDKIGSEPLARRALLLRAEVLSVLGHHGAARDSLELLAGQPQSTAQVGMARVLLAVRRGSRRDANRALRPLGEHSHAEAARAALAYYIGDYEEAIDHARRARTQVDAPDQLVRLRYLASSLSAVNRGREALAALDSARVSVLEQAGVDALRMRVLARVGPSVEGATNDYERFAALEPTSLDRALDLAEVAFWHKRFEEASKWAELALSLAEDHPEAHWLRGLLLQIAGDGDGARAHFRAAWRDDNEDPTLLNELGGIYMNLDEPARARKTYYRALLRDRKSLEALRGMGQAYLASEPARGRRDMKRIYRGYAGTTRYVAQAAETLKWLAILHGSRRGEERGLQYLHQARDLKGDSADLLVEQARYHEAGGEGTQARQLYVQALEKNVTQADARLGLARTALAAGDTDVASAQLRRYLRFAPDGEQANWARERLAEIDAVRSPESE